MSEWAYVNEEAGTASALLDNIFKLNSIENLFGARNHLGVAQPEVEAHQTLLQPRLTKRVRHLCANIPVLQSTYALYILHFSTCVFVLSYHCRVFIFSQ